MAFNKKTARLRRSRQTRLRIKSLDVPRLSVFCSNKHVYAQILSSDGAKVFVAVSTVEAAVKAELPKSTADVNAATLVGRLIAEKAKKTGISSVAFDRSGYKYHGRVRALAESAREAGLSF